MFFTPAYAQAAGAAGGGSILGALLPWIFILVIFYFLLIRPQQKRVKEHRAMCDAASRGDTVVTQGGIVGKVTKVLDEEVMVEISEGVKVKVIKSTLADVRVKGEKVKESKKIEKQDYPTDQKKAYKVLGLEIGASPKEIKKAHKDLMKKGHPDSGGSEDWAVKINEARDVLLRK